MVLDPMVAQVTKVSGIVLQVDDSLPAFASVIFKEDSLNGDNIDIKDGKFSISTKKSVTAIIVRGTGYKTVEYPIIAGKNNKDVLIYLETASNEIKEFTVKPKRNPAEVLIDSVIARRRFTDFKRANSFFVSVYENTKLSIFNVSLDDHDEYSVKAKTKAGSKMSRASLIVQTAPKIKLPERL